MFLIVASFKRKQRFRIVPRLIDVASDPHQSAQMRSLSFLALAEITGEKVFPDAVAWRRWYEDNASKKRAQLAALDWWQVSGDN